ncbi:MAG: nickel pincer cofactor biosynthesis protein LarB [Planctomycetota bacterium]|nr:nickel pincer cofactor biosynthesis protein LarB [Planctomycetota bacterium]
MEIDQIRQLLELVSQGNLSVEAAQKELAAQGGVRVEGVTLDLDRQRRCGFPEVIFGENKTAETIASTMQAQRDHGYPSLATRVSADKAAVVKARLEGVIYNEAARVLRWNLEGSQTISGRVLVISAGTSDLPVAAEAVETLIWMGVDYEFIEDVGVAGPHRLIEHVENLRSADVLIVVAGLEGALPSVVGGYVDSPVLAVPTSVGYSTAFGGITALLGMLNSCASNVLVTNVDAGFKAAYNAGVMLRRLKGTER